LDAWPGKPALWGNFGGTSFTVKQGGQKEQSVGESTLVLSVHGFIISTVSKIWQQRYVNCLTHSGLHPDLKCAVHC
jgi:hypothetical protein